MQTHDHQTPSAIITVKVIIIWTFINSLWRLFEIYFDHNIQESTADTIISIILLGFIWTCIYFKNKITALKQQVYAQYPPNNNKATMYIHIQAPVDTAKYAAKLLISTAPDIKVAKVTGDKKCCNIYLNMCIDGINPDENK